MLSYHVESNEFIDWSHPKNNIASLGVNDLADGNFIFSSSVLMKNDFIIEEWWHNLPFCDWPLYLLQINNRKIKVLDEIMGVYRVHSGGTFSSVSKQKQLVKEIDCIKTMLVYSNLGIGTKSILGSTLMKKIKLLGEGYVYDFNDKISKLNESICVKENKLNAYEDKLNTYESELSLFSEKLKKIRKTYSYKLLVKMELYFKQ